MYRLSTAFDAEGGWLDEYQRHREGVKELLQAERKEMTEKLVSSIKETTTSL